MTEQQVEIVRQLRHLRHKWADYLLHDFRVSQSHTEALMTEHERNNAPDGTRVGIWALWTDCEGKRRWMYAG